MGEKADRKTPKTTWVDMCVTELKKVADFYADVIGWGMEPCVEDDENTSYAMTDHQGEEVLGVCDETVFSNWVSGWTPYFEIENLEECVANIELLGGKIVKQGSQSSEQKFCLFRDPAGAPMMLHEIKK